MLLWYNSNLLLLNSVHDLGLHKILRGNMIKTGHRALFKCPIMKPSDDVYL